MFPRRGSGRGPGGSLNLLLVINLTKTAMIVVAAIILVDIENCSTSCKKLFTKLSSMLNMMNLLSLLFVFEVGRNDKNEK